MFYELGLAHALGKEVVLSAQGIERPPFDISTARLLRYELNALSAFEAELCKAFASVAARYSYFMLPWAAAAACGSSPAATQGSASAASRG